ncbi:threonine/serine ThrE exporter family protein [Luteococcus peritonei]|uniref:Threonine/serine exporter ThrE family protein n=1 Tax=Luteococcus peritonei TaxID=88874 RepID=A0ABW4RTD9_9ACTN
MPASRPRAFGPRPVAHAHSSARREHALANDPGTTAEQAREVIDLAIQASELLLASGASAAATTAQATRLGRSFGVALGVDVTYTRIVVSAEVPGALPMTVMRLAPTGAQDYDRLARVESLVGSVDHDGLAVETVRARLHHISAEPHGYQRWLSLLAAGLLGGGVALLLDGGWADIAACMLATLLVELVRRGLASRGMSNFFTQALSAVLPTGLGLGLLVLRPVLPDGLPLPSPSLAVAAGMVSLLAGIGVVGAASDAVDGYYLSAAARVLEVTVLTAAIVVGLMTTLSLGLLLGVSAQLSPTAGDEASVWLRLLAGGLVAGCFAVSCTLEPRSLPAAMLLGVMAQAAYLAVWHLLPSAPAASGVAAIGVGLVARLVSHPIRTPLVALVTTSVAALMPGLLLYRGIFAVLFNSRAGQQESASALLTDCALTAVLLAAGSSFGISLGGLLLRLARRSPSEALAPVAGPAERLDGPPTSRVFRPS